MVCFQVEFGAGDIRGPVFGMKLFRNVTARWQVFAIHFRFRKLLKLNPCKSLRTSCSYRDDNALTQGERLDVCLLPRVYSFVTAQCSVQFSSRGVKPGVSTTMARHLDQNTMGYLQWRWGSESAMTTSVVRDTKTTHFTLALQVTPACLCMSP